MRIWLPCGCGHLRASLGGHAGWWWPGGVEGSARGQAFGYRGVFVSSELM